MIISDWWYGYGAWKGSEHERTGGSRLETSEEGASLMDDKYIACGKTTCKLFTAIMISIYLTLYAKIQQTSACQAAGSRLYNYNP